MPDPEEVAEQVHTSTVARAAGYGAAALIFWPFAIPAVVDGVKSAQANDALDDDFCTKSAKDQIIAPHSHVNMLMFVPMQCYNSTFHVTLVDLKNNQPREVRCARHPVSGGKRRIDGWEDMLFPNHLFNIRLSKQFWFCSRN